MLLIFDVDGTLTPSRGKMDPAFKSWFIQHAADRSVLVTGSDPDKTREQIGNNLYEKLTVYNCAGNHVFYRGIEIYRNDWALDDDFYAWLQTQVSRSTYPVRTGRHIEHRVGLVNLSIVGRNADLDQRKHYYEWDLETRERENIAKQLMQVWPDIEATVAGETGIDIYPKGLSKQQLAHKLAAKAPLHFFGDRMDPAGNDYSLAAAIREQNLGITYHVRDWQDTWDKLIHLIGE